MIQSRIIVTSEVIGIDADQHIHVMEIEKTELRANHIVLTISIYYLRMYVCGWPNNFLNGQILVEVPIWPYVLLFLILNSDMCTVATGV